MIERQGHGKAGMGSRVLALALAGLAQMLVVAGLVWGLAERAPAPKARCEVGEVTCVTTILSWPADRPPAKSVAKPAGNSGAAGKKAVPRAIAAPPPRIATAPIDAPPIAATVAANTSGAAAGAGTGAGMAGTGTGQGGAGDGQGGGTKVRKIAGEINSARDYPIASRDLRINDYVIIVLTVSAEGRPTACQIHRPSHDAQADAITCRLALERFRFVPATGAAGQPVESQFGWQQKWHY